MSSKLAKGSIVVLIGSFIFRIGGYIYRVLMANMLGPSGYGVLGLTMPIQGFLIMIAGAGLPPAIAKFVAEYQAQGREDLVKEVISTSLKMMALLGIIFSFVIFLLAKPLAIGLFHKPEAVLPFQLIALITPFSVIVGAFRGTFQGFYQMTNILITRAVEQIFMIGVAVGLVLLGVYVAGAVIGTAVGFFAAMISAIILFRKEIAKKLSHPRNRLSRVKRKFTIREQMSMAKMLFLFSVPVVISGLAELAIYDLDTFVIGVYMPSSAVGYYNAASPIARLPLIISMSIATSVLPATSEAMGLKDKNLLYTYILQSYRYVSMTVLPLCIGMIVFATPIMGILFGATYIPAAESLQIMTAGMLFFTIYMISSSISQGLGKPVLPMVILLIGIVIDLALNIAFVPKFGINGAALATAISSFFIMAGVLGKTLQLARVRLPLGDFGKIGIASILMGVVLMFFPKTYISFLLALLVAPFLYMGFLSITGGLKKEDVHVMHRLAAKSGPLEGYFNKFIRLFERFAT